MSFLVTGGTGFVGSFVVHNLLQHNEEVICADKHPDPDVTRGFPSGIEIVECDVSDQTQVEALLQSHPQVDRIVHLAYIMGAESEANPTTAMRVNTLGTANVFEAGCKNRVSRILFLSSESVYGKQSIYGDRPVKEEDYCAPKDHILNYSLSKLLNEHLAAKYEARYGTEIIALRAPIVFGPGRKRGTTVWASDFATLPALGKQVSLPFPSHDLNCYIYVEDLAEQLYLLSTKSTLAHRIYNSGGHTVKAADIAEYVRRAIPEARILFREELPMSPFIQKMDDSRIQKELNFLLRPMAEAISDHIQKVRRSNLSGKRG
jgi:nucleoside-diphosphate-sugar epimerase